MATVILLTVIVATRPELFAQFIVQFASWIASLIQIAGENFATPPLPDLLDCSRGRVPKRVLWYFSVSPESPGSDPEAAAKSAAHAS
jgi:hypothetical protein